MPREPVGLWRTAGTIKKRENPKQDCRKSLHHEEPSPARNTSPMLAQNPSGQGRTDDAGHRDRSHKDSSRFGAILVAEPMGEIDDDAREKACFRDSEQESSQIELTRCVHRRHENGNQSPSHQDPRNPFACAPALHDQRARYFKQKVADGENAGAQTKDAIAEVQVTRRLAARITHVDPTPQDTYVEDNKKWQPAA